MLVKRAKKCERVPYVDSERGVALLTVLLLIVFMSSVALAITDDIRFSIRRTVNVQMAEQAQWYALGAEQLARHTLWSAWKRNPDRAMLSDPWARAPSNFPIDGGEITAVIKDGGNCFNLNSVVVTGERGEFVERELGVAQYQNLLKALDFDRNTAAVLTSALVDWIDTDSIPGSQGAEDYFYANLTPPYRTGGSLLVEPSEVRAIKGYSELIYQRIRPFICAYPSANLSNLNVNTLREFDAPLLVMLVGRDLHPSEAARAIARRPSGGFGDVDEFLSDEPLVKFSIDESVRDQFVLRTQFFDFQTRVIFHDALVEMNSVIEVAHGGKVQTLARRFGAAE